MGREERIQIRIYESTLAKTELAYNVKSITDVVDIIVESYKKKGKLVLFGNGGSAAQASHIAAEFSIRYEMDRPPLEAIALNSDISVITAAGNDFKYENVFEKQVEGCVKKNDVVIGLTTSGNSLNVLKGLKKAKKMGATSIAMTGRKRLYNGNGKLTENRRRALELRTADYIIPVPSERTSVIQEAHIMIGHIICGEVEEKLFEEN
ncbi:MAG: SIS domain-containing protein [Nanoarchaeota archaeon]|nr:SIS domain-containing protein [Nanoarchaeota archaeon]